MSDAYRILIAEDEGQIRDVVAKYLRAAGYDVLEAKDGVEALSLFNEYGPQFLILDVMMPGINGFEVLKEVRLSSQVPVLMLTAKQDEVDRLKGFDLGADDYVSKPFSPKEVVRRVNVIIKRCYQTQSVKSVWRFADLELDGASQKLYQCGKELDITANEFRILKVFFTHQGQLLSREQLIEDAFGAGYDGFDRNMDSYIKKLRHKLEEDTKNPKYLRTKYGAGYIFGGERCDD